VDPVARGAARDRDDRLAGEVLDRDLRVRQRARDVEEQTPRDHDLPLAVHVRLERGTEREFHVGGRELELASLCAQLDAAEDEHRRPRRRRACDEREPFGKRVACDRQLQVGLHHHV
jgi:hypothetical protein